MLFIFVCIQVGLSMSRNTVSQSQTKITSSQLDAPQSNTEHGDETGSGDDTDSDNFNDSDTDDTKVASSEVAKRLPGDLEQIKKTRMDQHTKRHSRRLLGKEDKTGDTPAQYQSRYRQSPHKKDRSRRDGRSKRKGEQLLDSKVTDSPLLQANANRKKKR